MEENKYTKAIDTLFELEDEKVFRSLSKLFNSKADSIKACEELLESIKKEQT